MLKIKELLKDFIETQKQINESIKALKEALKETKDFESNKLNSTICTINRLDSALATNIYTKEETVEAINKELDFKEKLEKIHKECPALLELIEDVSKKCANADKYEIVNTTIMFSNYYKVQKI